MDLKKAVFEVEFRCHFSNIDEAFNALPFLRTCLHIQCVWNTAIYGLELFRSGQLLRIAKVEIDRHARYFVGWKGPDSGRFANIRQEIDEELTATATFSRVLKGLGGRVKSGNIENVILELERLGHPRFMEFSGNDLYGCFEPYGIKVKAMTCGQLKWPLLVEIEKTAGSAAEALRCEKALQDLCWQLRLQDRLVKEEPPTLLYNATFASRPGMA